MLKYCENYQGFSFLKNLIFLNLSKYFYETAEHKNDGVIRSALLRLHIERKKKKYV